MPPPTLPPPTLPTPDLPPTRVSSPPVPAVTSNLKLRNTIEAAALSVSLYFFPYR